MAQTVEILMSELIQKWNLGEIPATAKVSITLDDTAQIKHVQTPIYYGMFKGNFPDISLEDFKIAEFNGDSDDGLDWEK